MPKSSLRPFDSLGLSVDSDAQLWDEKKNPEGRWRVFTHEELAARDKGSLDIFWLKDESLEDSAKLPEPHMLAEEIADDLRSALEQIESVLGDLTARALRMSARDAELAREAEPTFALEPSPAQPQPKVKRRGARS